MKREYGEFHIALKLKLNSLNESFILFDSTLVNDFVYILNTSHGLVFEFINIVENDDFYTLTNARYNL